MNKGFSLIEVIITITIIGILSGIMIPSYSNYSKSSENLEVQEKTFIIQNEIMTFINQQIMNKTNSYPIIGLTSTEYIGVNNINAQSLKTFVRGVMSKSQILDINTFVLISEEEFSGFKNGIGYMNVRITYKTNESVICEFQISDNQLDYKDVATLYSITYCDGKGNEYRTLM